MNNIRNISLLFLLYLSALLGGYLLIENNQFSLSFKTFAILLSVMTAITAGAYGLIALGMRKAESDRGIYLLAALGGKFLLYLVLLLIFWAVGKNLTLPFIIAFFVLYLMLTFFLVGVLIKTLKTK